MQESRDYFLNKFPDLSDELSLLFQAIEGIDENPSLQNSLDGQLENLRTQNEDAWQEIEIVLQKHSQDRQRTKQELQNKIINQFDDQPHVHDYYNIRGQPLTSQKFDSLCSGSDLKNEDFSPQHLVANGDEISQNSLEQILKEGLEKFELKFALDIAAEIAEKQEDLIKYQAEEKIKKIEQTKDDLTALIELKQISKQLQEIQENTLRKEIANLEKILQNGLLDLDLKSSDKLIDEIQETIKQIEKHEKKGQKISASKCKITLEILEDLLRYSDKIKLLSEQIQYQNLDFKIRDLELQLVNGLKIYEIADPATLAEEIDDKKQEIIRLLKDGRQTAANERKKSLENFEKLLEISTEINKCKNLMTDKSEIIQDSEEVKETQHMDQEIPTEIQKNDKINEKLQNILVDYENMPQCSQRILYHMLYSLGCMINKIVPYNEEALQQEDLKICLEQELNKLKELLQQECLNNKEIDEYLIKIEISFKQANWENGELYLKKILEKIKIFDIQELKRLMSKFGNTANIIKDKDIILLLGPSGAGKSTTTHFLAGSQMIRCKNGNFTHIEAINVTNSQLKVIKPDPTSVSGTRYISPVEIQFIKLVKKGCTRRSGSIFICDTPGFEDTNGPEVDIANGIGLTLAIHLCKTVRPVIVISQIALGDNFYGLKTLAKTIIQMSKNPQDVIDSLQYIFTKYNEIDKENLIPMLTDIRDHIEDYDYYAKFFDNMLAKLDEQEKINFINPIEDKSPGKILEKLSNFVCIEDPKNTFCQFVSEKSKGILIEQIRLHQQLINNAFSTGNYLLVLYKLDELLFLVEEIQDIKAKEIYNECINALSKIINNNQKKAIDNFNACFSYQNQMLIEDIEVYIKQIIASKKFECLKQKHINSDTGATSKFFENLNYQVKRMIQKIDTEQQNYHYQAIALDKLLLLSGKFEDIEDIYIQKCSQVELDINTKKQLFLKHVQNNDFIKCAEVLNDLQELSKFFKNHNDETQMQENYIQLKNHLFCHLKSIQSSCKNIFAQKSFKHTDIEQLKLCVQILNSARGKENFELKLHFSYDDICEIYNSFIQEILMHFEDISSEIDRLFETKREKSFIELEQLFLEMTLIRSIQDIEAQISSQYFSIQESLCGYIYQLRRDIEEILQQFYSQTTQQEIVNLNYNRLLECLICLKNAKWIEVYKKGVYSEISLEVEDQVVKYLKSMQEQLNEINLGIAFYKQMDQLYPLIQEINKMTVLIPAISTIELIIKECNDLISENLNNNFDKIKEALDLKTNKNQQFQKFIENSINYLSKCRNIKDFKNPSETLLIDIGQFMIDYIEVVRDDFRQSYQKILDYDGTDKDSLKINLAKLFHAQVNWHELISKYPGRLGDVDLKENQILIKEQIKKFSEDQKELCNSMYSSNANNQYQKLTNQLLIAKVLSQLDNVMKESKFIEAYQTYREIFTKQAPVALFKIVEQIQEYKFTLVNLEMCELKKNEEQVESANNLQKLIPCLNYNIEILIQETRSLAAQTIIKSNFNIDKIKQLMVNLERIQNAQEVNDFLYQKINIKECLDEFKNTITESMKEHLKKIQIQIKNLNFIQADKDINEIKLIQNELVKFLLPEAIQKCKALDNFKDDQLQEKIDKYKDLSIEFYFYYPPKDIIEKLSLANEYNSDYETVKSKIECNISFCLTEKFKEMKNLKSQFQINREISQIQRILPYLTVNLQNILKQKIEEFKADNIYKSSNMDIELTEQLEQNNIDKIKELLTEYNIDPINHRQYISRIRKYVITQSENGSKKLQQLMGESDIKAVLVLLIDQNNFFELFGESFKEILSQKLEIIQFFRKKINDEYKFLIDFFLDNSEDSLLEIQLYKMNFLDYPRQNLQLSQIKLEQIKISSIFNMIIDIALYKDDPVFQSIILEVIPDIDNFIQKIVQIITNQFAKYQNKYEIAYDTKNIISLICILKNMKKWDEIYKIIISKKAELQVISNFAPITNVPVNCMPYSEMIKQIFQQIKTIKDCFFNENLINESTNNIQRDRDQYYSFLKQDIEYLDYVELLEIHSQLGIDINLNTIKEECLSKLDFKVKFIIKQAQNLVKQTVINVKDSQKFTIYIHNLQSIMKIMGNQGYENTKEIEEITDQIYRKVKQLHTHIIEDTQNLQSSADMIIQMKQISKNLTYFQDYIDITIDDILKTFKVADISRIGILLNQNTIGKLVTSEHKIFVGFLRSNFNIKAQRYTIEQVLERLKEKNDDTQILKSKYTKFYEIYQTLVNKYLKPNLQIQEPLFDCNLIVKQLQRTNQNSLIKFNIQMNQNNQQYYWSDTNSNQVLQLIAHIFALWTLSNATHFFAAEGLDQQKTYLFTPHPAQVISIFLLLGIGSTQKQLCNNLIEIKTGEGKSITLAISAIILALVGYEVYCACYSDYLGKRDYEQFNSLFTLLEVADKIQYGTFNQLSESIINSNGDIRNRINSVIKNQQNPILNNIDKKREKILLVDEVDVFFSKSFFGKTYSIQTNIIDPSIEQLVDYIWNTKDQKLSYKKIISSNEYQICYKQQIFKGWEFLIEEAVKFMLEDLKDFQNHDYIIKDDKIGYKEQDNIVFNVAIGYKTLFAYYFENERSRVSETNLAKYKSIGVSCGQFSYAEMLKHFNFILGVSGTLQTLSKMEKDIIENYYNIKSYQYIPSVFGPNQLQFNKESDVKLRNQDDYFNEIINEIQKKLVGNTIGTKRAVLVFFESTKDLEKFTNDTQFSTIFDNAQIMYEDQTAETKEYKIKNASNQGYVTLLTKEYGRGTDFISRDEILNSCGGVHVIQTFLSEEISEEVQIKGRTARQEQNGSFSLILLDTSLEKFKISLNEIEESKGDIYDMINEKRKKYFETQYQNNREFVNQLKIGHDKAWKLLQNIDSNKLEEIRNYLQKLNKGPNPSNNPTKTLCIIDATGSMGELLQKSKNTVSEMMRRTVEVLKEKNINEDSFKIQFAFYRNYNSYEDILQFSSWETKPDQLFQYLSTIEAKQGWSEEAIEIGLWHANQENENDPISQVILIGDSCANSEEDVERKRNSNWYKHDWSKTKFKEPTFYKTEMLKLKAHKIPIHAFYVKGGAEANFKEIASETGGRCEFLDIESEKGAEMLTDLITSEMIRKAGQQNGKEEEFMEYYRNRYPKNYL